MNAAQTQQWLSQCDHVINASRVANISLVVAVVRGVTCCCCALIGWSNCQSVGEGLSELWLLVAMATSGVRVM